jgi:hypothetical protein
LKESIINKLLVFERKILRKIFGPNNENGIWRIKTNQELDEIIKRKNIINFIPAQRLSWLVTLKGSRYENGKGNLLLETHMKTKDTLWG